MAQAPCARAASTGGCHPCAPRRRCRFEKDTAQTFSGSSCFFRDGPVPLHVPEHLACGRERALEPGFVSQPMKMRGGGWTSASAASFPCRSARGGMNHSPLYVSSARALYSAPSFAKPPPSWPCQFFRAAMRAAAALKVSSAFFSVRIHEVPGRGEDVEDPAETFAVLVPRRPCADEDAFFRAGFVLRRRGRGFLQSQGPAAR